ncbi:DsbA family oxidoreductase [Bacillus sp. JJ1521]|uniref:DsbA family oxidoreductase n=1 Tax=Bacillus sp. JJ1521 TaxID=3122957 RepID=UPI002FFE5BAE
MKIEVWSDFVCPFCYVGKRRLEEALAQFPNRDQVEVEFKSFELDPNAKLYSGQSIHELLASKYGTSVEQARQMNENVGQQATGVGLKYDFDKMKHTNTFDAHRLVKYAATVGKEKEMTEILLHSYFEEGKLISDHEVLADLAESVGVDRQSALDVLKDAKKFANDVRIDESIAQQIGVTGVPFFVINQKYSISGAQPTSTFLGALQQVWKEENPAE